MEKKPSTRIKEIMSHTATTNDINHPYYANALILSIMNYLDEEYEKQQRREVNYLMNIKNEK